MIKLRKIKLSDKKYFAKWWRDKELLKTSTGRLDRIIDQEVDEHFDWIFKDSKDLHYIITLNQKPIGHILLKQRKNKWHETQIIIGEKKQQGKGYGTTAIKMLIAKAKKLGISKIYLEVRPNNKKAIRAYLKCGFVKAGIKKYIKNKYLKQTIKMVLPK